MTPEEFLQIYESLSPDERGCRIWPKGPHTNGYPREKMDGVDQRVSRISLSCKLCRPLREGMNALHTCDVRMCVSFDHLYEGTYEQNAQDMVRRGRHGSRTKPESTPRGSRHWASRLTEAQVRVIKCAHRSGRYSQKALADRFGVSTTQISSIVTGYSWRYVL